MEYYHQLDPFLISFGGNLGIRWYSLAYILGAGSAYLAGIYLIKKGRLFFSKDKLGDIVVFGAIGAIVGGRLGYCLFYKPELFMTFDSSFPFWAALKIHQGGMSSHGGMAGLLLSQIFYSWRHKLPFFSLIDLAAISGAIGIFFGRIANFINGELFGRIVEGKAWLSVRFPSELYLWAEEPARFKKSLLSLGDLISSAGKALKSELKLPSPESWADWVSKASQGDPFYEGRVSYLCDRIIQSAQASPVRELLEPLLFLRHPSQLYQSFFGGFLTFCIICLLWLKPRKPGLISLVWIFSYLSFRIGTEFFRQPDPHLGFQLLNLTRGQWLSGLIILCAFGYGFFVYRQKPKGWRRAYQS